MRRAGKINLIAVVVLAGLAGGLWWIINYASAYLDNWDVKDAVKGAYNSAWHTADDQLRLDIRNKTNASQLGWHEETDEYGAVKKVNGLGIDNDQVEITRDEVTNTIRIHVAYKRKVYLWPWPGKDNVRWVNFSETVTGPIKPPNQQ